MLFRVLFMREGTGWIAQCLDHDIATQGLTLQDTKLAFVRVVAAQIVVATHHGEDPLTFIKSFDRAPAEYWKYFERAEPLGEPIRVPDRIEIPPAFMLNPIQKSLAHGWVA